MVVNGGIGAVALYGLTQILLGQLVLPQLEVGPAQRIEIGAVHRLQLDGLANQLESLGQAHSLVGQHVAEVIEGHGVGGIQFQGLAEELFGGLVMLLAFSPLAAKEEQVGAVLLLGGKRGCLGEVFVGVFPAAQAHLHLAQGQPDHAVFLRAVQQPPGQSQALVGLALVGQLAGQHQLELAILGVGFDGLARDLDGLVEDPGVAVGVHLPLVAPQGQIATHVDELLIGADGRVDLVLLVIDGPQPFQEDAAIVLFLDCIRAVGVRGHFHHLLVGLGGLVEAAQHVQQQTLVIAGFQ